MWEAYVRYRMILRLLDAARMYVIFMNRLKSFSISVLSREGIADSGESITASR